MAEQVQRWIHDWKYKKKIFNQGHLLFIFYLYSDARSALSQSQPIAKISYPGSTVQKNSVHILAAD